jgi:hypothetical protein
MKKPKRPTHEEIQAAVQRFVRQGGNIDKLPDQKSSRSEFVGSEKYESFETFSSLLSPV